jgi:peroxiredoxin
MYPTVVAWAQSWLRSAPRALRALQGGMLGAALLTVALVAGFRACAPSATTPRALLDHPASVFTLPAERNGESLATPITFIPASGRPTLLVFFYTLCAHCLLQIQSSHVVAAEFPGLRSVYIDSPAERANLPDMMLQRLAIADPVLLDTDGKVAARFGLAYYPSQILIDGRGIIRGIWVGEVDSATLRNDIARALAQRTGG